MKTSTDRILTTHVGSMPRPDDMLDLLRREDRGEAVDQTALQARATTAVAETVKAQVSAGIDVVNDGEQSKMSYHVYLKHRLSGLTNIEGFGVPDRPHPADIMDFPELIPNPLGGGGTDLLKATVCSGPVAYKDRAPLDRDLDNLKAAVAKAKPVDAFMTSASPGCLSTYVPNRFYPSRDKYREDLAVAMRTEYEAIHKAGFALQVDCPDLAGCRHTDYQKMSDTEFMKDAEKSIEALNEATKNIPPQNMRMHICWLNYSGPHTHDIPVASLFALLAKARPAALLFEGANPRHEHEWEDWKAAKLPDHKILVPGVIDSTCNFVEHPRLVAQRIRHYADIVGRERVMAGADCGFGTYAGRKGVPPSVVMAKFRALAEGAELASKALWGRK
jgi:5-methyltetrahydropteroyltriglutamate--homocysteine methyltransferase